MELIGRSRWPLKERQSGVGERALALRTTCPVLTDHEREVGCVGPKRNPSALVIRAHSCEAIGTADLALEMKDV